MASQQKLRQSTAMLQLIELDIIYRSKLEYIYDSKLGDYAKDYGSKAYYIERANKLLKWKVKKEEKFLKKIFNRLFKIVDDRDFCLLFCKTLKESRSSLPLFSRKIKSINQISPSTRYRLHSKCKLSMSICCLELLAFGLQAGYINVKPNISKSK